jgi:Flp pilus assembly protein TadB
MKRNLPSQRTFLRISLALAMLLMVFQANGQTFSGQEAESGFMQEKPFQSEQEMDKDFRQNSWEHRLEIKKSSNTASKRLQKAVEKLQSRPNRPIPIILIILGVLLLALWGIVLVATILAVNAAIFILMLLLTIVLLPVAIIGLLLLIGGIVGEAGGRRRQDK